MTTNELRTKAFDKWAELIERDAEADYKVNNLLQNLTGYTPEQYDELDDPIYEIINNWLSDEALLLFLEGCEKI